MFLYRDMNMKISDLFTATQDKRVGSNFLEYKKPDITWDTWLTVYCFLEEAAFIVDHVT